MAQAESIPNTTQTRRKALTAIVGMTGAIAALPAAAATIPTDAAHDCGACRQGAVGTVQLQSLLERNVRRRQLGSSGRAQSDRCRPGIQSVVFA
jgi:hypothetical protein